MTGDAPKERKKPGRKSETPAEKLARLERKMQLARQALAADTQQRLATVGEAIIAEAQSDTACKKHLHRILRARVTSKAGKALIASLLGTAPVETENA